MLKRKIFVFIIIITILLPYNISYGKNESLKLYSKSAALIDGLNGSLLYGKNENVPLSMASTTKIMTCIIALESGNTNQYITVSKKAENQPKVHLNIKEGEKYKLEDLLYSMMLESHNDSSVCIAEGVGGSVEEFAILMNDKAKSLGLVDTYFITPNGLDAETDETSHHTTAFELATIMRYCINISPKKEEFKKITQTKSYTFSNVNGNRTFTCNNHNTLFNMMDDVITGKTGYTSKAGYCYVGAIENEGRVYIVALLACGWPNNKNYKWKDAMALFDFGKKNFYYIDINSIELPDDIYGKRKIRFDNPYVNPVFLDVIISEIYKKSDYAMVEDTSKLTIVYNTLDDCIAPYNVKESIGYVNYYLDNELVIAFQLYLSDNINEPDYKYYLKNVTKLFVFG